jgi:endoglucanase
MLNVTTPHRLVADWVALRPGRGFVLDAEVGTIGSYDAIRCYLWAGMLSQDDPERQRLLTRMKGMVQVVEKQLAPPEKIDAMSGRFEGGGPAGFSAALLPYLNATKAEAAISLQRTKITAMGGIPSIYYEQVLSLFAFGWMDQRFRFGRDGRLVIKKNATCKK